MKVYIDGKEVEIKNDIRIVEEKTIIDISDKNEDVYGDITLIANHEGVIIDITEDGEEEPDKSTYLFYEDFIKFCH
jgi:hypothetical protein